VEDIDVGTITASDVPIARCISTAVGIPSSGNTSASAGTMTTPPPRPSMPAMSPASAPTARYATSITP
jgi:hypothetical protein